MGLANLHSFIGLFVIASTAWLFSEQRKHVNWRVVTWGIGMQLTFGLLIFLLPAGRHLFLWLNGFALKILSYADAGTNFVLGPLATGKFSPGQKQPFFILGTQALPKVIFFAALVGLLYHIGVMQLVVRLFSYVFTRTMRISGAESLSVSSNIFVGIESAFIIRPFYKNMTRSELCTVLAGCMATIASTVLGLYVVFLSPRFPTIAGHLISACLLSAPAVLVASKLMVPEQGEPETLGHVVSGEFEKADNWIDAIVKNAMDGVRLAVGIAAMLIAFKGLVAMADGFLGWLGSLVALKSLKMSTTLGYAFAPFTWLMGVPWADISKVSGLLGTRMVETEVPSYIGLSVMMKQCAISPRAAVIASYSLCGFAHLPSIAIFVGGIAALVPSRSKDLSALAFKALFIATIACLMTGAVAGIFYTGPNVLMTKGSYKGCTPPQKQKKQPQVPPSRTPQTRTQSQKTIQAKKGAKAPSKAPAKTAPAATKLPTQPRREAPRARPTPR